MCFFQKVTPNFFCISDILVQKLKLFVFYMMLNSQVLKKVSFQEKRRKIWKLWTPLVVFLVSGGISDGARPFPLKIFDTKISINSTSGECIKYKTQIVRWRHVRCDFLSHVTKHRTRARVGSCSKWQYDNKVKCQI